MPPTLELQDRLNWNLLYREAKQAQYVEGSQTFFYPIPSTFVQTSARILLAGTKAQHAKPHWWYGGRIFGLLPVTPSATSEFNLGTTDALSEFYSAPVPLNRLKLLMLPELQPRPFSIKLETAGWHRQIFWEVWEYSGQDTDTIAQQLASIETKIDAL